MIDQKEIESMDAHWKEVIDLAFKYGFITYSYGGIAILTTHKNQLEDYGEKKYRHFQLNRFGRNV